MGMTPTWSALHSATLACGQRLSESSPRAVLPLPLLLPMPCIQALGQQARLHLCRLLRLLPTPTLASFPPLSEPLLPPPPPTPPLSAPPLPPPPPAPPLSAPRLPPPPPAPLLLAPRLLSLPTAPLLETRGLPPTVLPPVPQPPPLPIFPTAQKPRQARLLPLLLPLQLLPWRRPLLQLRPRISDTSTLLVMAGRPLTSAMKIPSSTVPKMTSSMVPTAAVTPLKPVLGRSNSHVLM